MNKYIRSLSRNFYIWYHKLDYTSYLILRIYRINQEYIKKGMDPMFIETRVLRGLNKYYPDSTLLQVCRATYKACKMGATEKEVMAILKDIVKTEAKTK